MENNVKITFWMNKTKKNSKNLIPVYLRVSHDYEHFVMATSVWIHASEWDKKAMRVRGSSPDTCTSNNSLETLRVKVIQAVNHLSVQGKPFNIHTIRKRLEGKDRSSVTLMMVIEEQISEMKKLKGKDFAPSTIVKYKNTQLRLKQFIKFKFHRSDIYLYELNYQFMKDFEAYLKEKHENSSVTVYKHYQRFTRILRQSMHKGYLEKYPFENYKIKLQRKKIEYLTQEEIDRIDQTNFRVERLNTIRDIFVFCIYTGLAYAEVESLTPDNITRGTDGELWLSIHRKKTKKDYQVPLLPRALEILEKYQNHPLCLKKGKCLAVPSNVKYNAYLKEIGSIAGIRKPLVTHLARKTFATTIALSNGMNIGVLSRILGHNSIKVTLDSYGTIIDELMLSNVKALKEKLAPSGKQGTGLVERSNALGELLTLARTASKN